jgi:hypothetical protein
MKMEFLSAGEHTGKKELINFPTSRPKRFHEKEKPYIVIISDEKPRFLVGIHFNYEGYFCSVDYLNKDLESVLLEAYVYHNQQLFLKNIQKWYRDGREISLVTYLYEVDGRYRKNFFIGGKETDDVEYGICDVSSHFREMIQFGNYDSILPEEARRGLREG